MSNELWVDKYRPRTLDDLMSHEHIRNALKKMISKQYVPHLLFYGPPGCGKTSAIQAVCHDIYGPEREHLMSIHLNASDKRGIKVVRNNIRSFAETVPPPPHTHLPKIVILDEADSMTRDAQLALRRMMEQYTEQIRICFLCNSIRHIHDSIQSRCMIFQFHPLTVDEVTRFIRGAPEINSTATTKQIHHLVNTCKGDMRAIIYRLQCLDGGEEGQQEHKACDPGTIINNFIDNTPIEHISFDVIHDLAQIERNLIDPHTPSIQTHAVQYILERTRHS